MADTAISALSALGAQPASTDLIPLVDVSDTTMSGNGTTKNVTYAYLTTGLLTDITGEAIGSLSDVTITTVADNEVLAYDSTAVGWVNQTAAEAGLAAASHTHVEADITDLGAYLTDITAESLGDLSDVTITTGAQGDILYYNGSAWVNLAPGTSGYFLKTQGAAANPTWDAIPGGGDMLAATYDADTDGVVDASEGVTFVARKASVGTITKGTPVYIVSYNVAGHIEVEAADADDAAKMPAVGVVTADMTNSADGYVLGLGQLDDIDTSSYSVGDDLYVSTATGLTSTKPTGDAEAIQKIAEVGRSHAVNGTIIVFGAGRSNDVSNKIDQKTLVLKQGAAPAPTAEGDIQWDTDDNRIAVGDGVGTVTFSNDTTNASTYAAASHAHAASDITSGTLAHERGGIEADISAITTGGILAGTGAGAMGIVSAAGKSDGDVLTLQADGTVAYETPVGGSGQSTYDAIVAASGGDYTTLTAALTAGATSVFVEDGTYTEAGGTFATNNLKIVGESRSGVVLNFGENDLTLSGTDVAIYSLGMDFTDAGTLALSGARWGLYGSRVTKVGTATGSARGINFTGANGVANSNYLYMDNSSTSNYSIVIGGAGSIFKANQVYVETDYSNGAFLVGVANCIVDSNYFEAITGSSAQYIMRISEFPAKVSNNMFYDANNTAKGIYQASYQSTITSNTFKGLATGVYIGNSYNIVTDNVFIPPASGNCVDIANSAQFSVIRGNLFYGTTSVVGINNLSESNVVTGNQFFSTPTGISMSTATDCKHNIITNNSFGSNTTNVVANWQYPNNNDVGNIIKDNWWSTSAYGTSVYEQVIEKWKNTSGGDIPAGSVVVMKAVAAGNEITTTTTGGDNLVVGMVAEYASSNAWTYVVTKGKVDALKVDGTTDIAIGDFLSTFTSAGIAKKASSGEMAFAIALEAYTTDDSNGVIDALIITPRQV